MVGSGCVRAGDRSGGSEMARRPGQCTFNTGRYRGPKPAFLHGGASN